MELKIKESSNSDKLQEESDPKLLEGAWYCPCGAFQPRFGVVGAFHEPDYKSNHKIIRGTKSRNIYQRY